LRPGLAQTAPKGKRCGGGFHLGNGLVRVMALLCPNSTVRMVYAAAMDPMMHIPKDRKPQSPFKLALLLGMTVLLFLMILTRYGEVAAAVLAAG
jgi:hypothetical protein